jgi:hypothetical protein
VWPSPPRHGRGRRSLLLRVFFLLRVRPGVARGGPCRGSYSVEELDGLPESVRRRPWRMP